MRSNLIVGSLFFLQCLAFGQRDLPVSFDVISVRPYAPDGKAQRPFSTGIRGGPGTADPTQITYQHIPLKFIVMNAFGITNAERVFGPSWMDSTSFDIVGKMPPDTTQDRLELMLQDLLATRFHMVAHHETKSYPGYEMTTAPSGPTLNRGIPVPTQQEHQGRFPIDSNGFPIIPSGSHAVVINSREGVAFVTFARFSMKDFAKWLSSQLGTADRNGSFTVLVGPDVIDHTGLAGEFDFTLRVEGLKPLIPVPSPDGDGTPNDLVGAVAKQLGLRLQSKKIGADVVVVDRVDRVPTPD